MNRNTALIAAILAAFALSSLPARAADEKTGDPAAAATAPAKKKVRPHSHLHEKTGVSPREPAARGSPKMPMHDHGVMHKQQ